MYDITVQQKVKFLGFKETRQQAIDRIRAGRIYHVPREYDKNEYAQGRLSDNDVIAMLQCCRGNRYEALPHHSILGLEVHIFKPVGKYDGYYIKLYFLEPDVCFISVHRSVHKAG